MYRKSLIRVAGLFAAAFVLAVAMLPGVAGNVAADEDPNLPKPIINTDFNPPHGSTPNCVAVKWAAPSVPPDSLGIAGYSVARDDPAFGPQDVGQILQKTVCDQRPDTPANFQVCALWVSDEEDPPTSCSPWVSLSTTPAGIGEMEPSGPLPVPPVHPIQNPGTTEFGVEWGWKGTNAGHYYDYYNITIAPEVQGYPMKHDDDGNWGWQRVTGLTPGTTYSVSVEGCNVDPIPYTNDNCSGYSAPVKVTTALPYGPDTCKQGFVWRDAFPGDHICVTPERRQKVADDLNTGNTRIPAPSQLSDPECHPITYMGPVNRFGHPDPPLPGCNFFGTKICLEGFVPRDIPGENVIVCVTPQERDTIAQENANPQQNRVQPR